jgi:meiotic recombination protein SPO11
MCVGACQADGDEGAHGRSKAALTTRVLELVHEVVTKRIHITKRDLFYTDVRLFRTQADSDPILDDVACMLGCTRSSLNGTHSKAGHVPARSRH